MDEVSSHWSTGQLKPSVKVGHFRVMKQQCVVLKTLTRGSKLNSRIRISWWKPLKPLITHNAQIVDPIAWKLISLTTLLIQKNQLTPFNLDIVMFYWNGQMYKP